MSPRVLAPIDEPELSEAEAVALLSEPPAPAAPEADRELTDEEAVQALSGVVPEKPGLLRAAAGAGLEGLATIPELGAEAASRLGEATGLGNETPFFDAMSGGLRGAAQAVYPAETRGRGGLPEQLASGAGSIIATGPAAALGGVPATIAYGAQTAMPLFYDTLEATGDREAATWNLLFGFGVGQLERFGAEKAAGSIIRKLATGKLGEAVERSVIAQVGGGAIGESATEVAQQGLSDALLEAFTDEDVANWERMKETLPPALLLGGAFHAVDAALARPMAKELAHADSAKTGKLAPNAESQGPEARGQPVSDVPAGGAQGAPAGGAVLPTVPPGTGPGADQGAKGASPGGPQDQDSVQRAHAAPRGEGTAVPGVPEPQGVGVPPEAGGGRGAGTAAVPVDEAQTAPPGDLAVPGTSPGVAAPQAVEGEAGATVAESAPSLTAEQEPIPSPDEVRAQYEDRGADTDIGRRFVFHSSSSGDLETTGAKPGQRGSIWVSRDRPRGAEYGDARYAIDTTKLPPGALLEGAEVEAAGFPPNARVIRGEVPPEAIVKLGDTDAMRKLVDVHAHVAEKAAGRVKAAPASRPALPEATPTPQPKAEPDEGTIQMFGGLPPLYESAPEVPGAAKRKLKKAKAALVQGLLKTHGGKPEAAALMEERARGEVEVAANKARGAVKSVKRAIRRFNRTTTDKITNAKLQEALTSPDALAKLPDAVRPQVEKMRALSDDLSAIMVREGMTSETMSEVIEGRMGEYLKRSYKAHQDPEWAEKVPLDIRNRLESLLVSWAEPLTPAVKKRLQGKAFEEGRPKTMEQREAHFELRSRRRLQGKSADDIRADMSAMLQDAKRVAENPWAAFAKSKLKRQDVSLFKARKGLPEEMRAFLGEEKDPYASYTNTILRQASFVATHRKFREMRHEAIDKWLFEKPTVRDGIEYTTRVSVSENPRLEPLVGDSALYTTETIKKALFDADKTLASAWWRRIVVANAILKGTKTIYQVYAVPKQAASQITALVRNGHMGYAMRHAKRVMDGMWGFGEEGKALREELLRLQVLDTSLAAAEFKDVQEIMASRRLNQPYRSIAKANDWIAAAFSQPDNFSKTTGYLKELELLEKVGITGERAKRQAADTVKNLYPTYGRIVEWVQQYRRQFILGTFVAFKAEQVRTRIEQLRLIGREMKSDNPKVRALAKRRAAYMIAGSVMGPAGTYAWNMLNGIDQEDDEKRRKKVPEYDRQRNLAWIGDKEYTDLSDIDDGSWITDPLMRILAGADAESVIKELWQENARPFLELSFFSEALAEWGFGRTKYGKLIDNNWEWFKDKVEPSSWKHLDFRDLTGVRIRKHK